jgi:hypothetical protein
MRKILSLIESQLDTEHREALAELTDLGVAVFSAALIVALLKVITSLLT